MNFRTNIAALAVAGTAAAPQRHRSLPASRRRWCEYRNAHPEVHVGATGDGEVL